MATKNRIELIEEKIIAHLKADENLKKYCKNFDVFDGDIEPDDITELGKNVPACLVSYMGDEFPEVNPGATYLVSATILVLACAKGLRDTDNDKGIFTMLEDITASIHLNILGGDLDLPMILRERAPWASGQQTIIYSLVFQTQLVN